MSNEDSFDAFIHTYSLLTIKKTEIRTSCVRKSKNSTFVRAEPMNQSKCIVHEVGEVVAAILIICVSNLRNHGNY